MANTINFTVIGKGITPQNFLSNTKALIGSDCAYRNDQLGVTQAIMFAHSYADDTLEQSNWESIVKHLQEKLGTEDGQDDNGDYENVSNWHIERFSHWLVKWVEYIVINVYTPSIAIPEAYQMRYGDLAITRAKHETTEAYDCMLDILHKLSNYPVFNEDHWSQLESEELYTYLADEIRFMRQTDQLTSKAPKSDDLIVWRIQQTDKFSRQVGNVGDIRGNMILEALQSLGYAYKHLTR